MALGDRVGRLIGTPPGTAVVGDTLSIKVYQALAAALELRPDRTTILSDTGNFPSDLYMAEGLADLVGGGRRLVVVEPEEVEGRLDEDVAALMLTEVDCRTGRRYDMDALTVAAHDIGALAIWDLAHSVGAVPVDENSARVDFAVGCTYKYHCAGPGAPAFIHVADRHADRTSPALSGWLGRVAPFDFDSSYRLAPGVARMRVGTPPVLQMAAMEVAHSTLWIMGVLAKGLRDTCWDDRSRHDRKHEGETCRQSRPEPLRKGFPADLVKRTRTMMSYLQIARSLDALRYPPGNHLEALAGERTGQHSVRLNNQWRICFIWTDEGPKDVEIVDYH